MPGWQCNNVAGRGTVCTCAQSEEICDGMDNDCDGVVDNPELADSDCSSGQPVRTYACVNGACVCVYVECDGECVDVAADPAQGACGGACIDPVNDTAHCGGCAPCPSGPHAATACQGGACVSTCAAGYFDCDGDPSTGCEIDLTSDPNNCGTCGRSCGGDACDAGSCHATTLADAAGATVIAVDDANVYWVTAGGDIMSVPVAGGATATLAAAEPDVRDIAVDGTSVYWGSHDGTCGSVKKVAREGGTPVELVRECDSMYFEIPGYIAVDATDAYYLMSGRYSQHIGRVPRDGGDTASWGNILYYSGSMALGPSHLCYFVVFSPELFCGPKGGGPGSYGTSYLPSRFAVTAEAAYVAASGRLVGYGTIAAVPLDGSPVVELADGVPGRIVTRIVTDGVAVYWIAYPDQEGQGGTMWKVPISGGTPVELGKCAADPCDFAIDATSFYWVDSGKILHMAK